MDLFDKATGTKSTKEVTIAKDEGNRPETTSEGLAALKPVVEGGVITAGNASQLSDGSSACVVMEASLAADRGLRPLGRYVDRKSTRLNSSHKCALRMPYSACKKKDKTAQ